MTYRLSFLAAAAVSAGLACTPRATPGREPAAAPSDVTSSTATAASLATDAAIAPAVADAASGISHADLMRLYYNDAGPPDVAELAAGDDPAIPDDVDFTGERPVAVTRARYTIVLPDEHSTLPTERALRVDDQLDRASVMLVGTGLPMVPGMRVAARAGYTGFAMVSPEGARYRAATPDALQRWFLGTASRPSGALSIRLGDNSLVATRGGLALVLTPDPHGAVSPLTCRTFIALFLGGDPLAAREGCATERLPLRATLSARGFRAVTLERVESAAVELPRVDMAVPPARATPTLQVPARASSGAFFAPTELAALPGRHTPEDILTVTNALPREALVFVDDVAIGWIAPGERGVFVGLASGPHAVRGRSFDGYERSRLVTATLPATVRLDNGPLAPPR